VRVCIVPMMKAIVSVYYLSFLVRLAVLVGTAGLYALADRSHYAQNDGTTWPVGMREIGH
jgi:hypothetical protein